MSMGDIVSKVVSGGKDLVYNLAQNQTSNRAIKYITRIYIGAVAILLLTWYGSWWYKTINMGSPDLTSLQQFINSTTNGTFLAFITFIAGLFIDTNKNNIPDALEKKPNSYGGSYNNCGGSSSSSSSSSPSAKMGGVGPGATTKPNT